MIVYHPDPLQLTTDYNPPEYIRLALPSGGHVLTEPCNTCSVRVVSINSTDPGDYLDSRYQPGNIIQLTYTATEN